MKRLVIIILCLLFISCPAIFAAASEDDGGGNSDIVYDWDELEDWLDDHWRTGGTVYLGADISVNGINSLDVSFYASDKVHIETGPYGFIVNRILYIGANIEITGHGDQTPVILVRDGGILHIDWVEYDEMALLEVTGDGGTGLRLEAGALYVSNPWSFMSYRASGACSVAIDSGIDLEMSNHYIDACGPGARGIVSNAQVDMLLSSVTSDGASITSPAITLDTCLVTPEVAEATIINRKITSVGPRFYPHDPIPAGIEQSGYFAQVNMFCIIILSAEGREDHDIYAYVGFEDFQVDYGTPGRYCLPPQLPLPAPYDIFSFNFEEAPATYPVIIYDPELPMLLDFYYANWTQEYVVRHVYSGNEFLTLWRSENEGETWDVFWKQDDEDSEGFFIWVDYDYIDFYISDRKILDTPAWFTYEVGSGKGSDVFYFDINNMVVGEYVGGDRDGGDRVMRPWEFFFGGGDDDQQSGNVNTDGKKTPPNDSDNNPNIPGPVIIQGEPLVNIGDVINDDGYMPLSEWPAEGGSATGMDTEWLTDDDTLTQEIVSGETAQERPAAAPGVLQAREEGRDLILESDNPIQLSSEPNATENVAGEDVAGEDDTENDEAPAIAGWEQSAETIPGPLSPALPEAFLTGTGVAEQVESGSPLIFVAIAAGVAGVGGGTGILFTVRRRIRGR